MSPNLFYLSLFRLEYSDALCPRCTVFLMSAVAESDVRDALGSLGNRPISQDERKNACRAIMRFKSGANDENESPIEVTEDWVRLYVALRRASGSSAVRLNATHLRRWRMQVSQSTTVKRKVFIVKKAALAELPAYPPDLQKWIIPRGDIDLPADIYGDDVVFVDDGYERSKLNLPGLLHLEVAVKCTRDNSSGRTSGLSEEFASDGEGSGRPSGSCSGVPSVVSDDIAMSVEDSKPPAAAAPAAEQHQPESMSLVTMQPGNEPEKAMADIIAQTVKALGLGRWVSHDLSLPNTVEFWVRLFTHDITKKPSAESKLTEPQRGYVRFITKVLYENENSYSNLPFIVPHLIKMQKWSTDLVPPLATVLVKLNEVDFEKPDTETTFHEWLQQEFKLAQMQTLYNSEMYTGFLKQRLAAQFKKAQQDQAARPTFLPLLQDSQLSEDMAAQVRIVATLDNSAVQLNQKVELLWSAPNAWAIISQWTGLKDQWAKYMPFAKNSTFPQASGFQAMNVYAVMGDLEDAGIVEVPNMGLKTLFAEFSKVRKTGNDFLSRVMQEQIVARMGAIAAAPAAETSEQSQDIDLSDCKEVAKELCKQWGAASKNAAAKYPLLKVLQDAFARTPRRTLSDAGKVDPKGAPAAPAAAGADQTIEDAEAGENNREGAPAAPAAADAAEDAPTVEVGSSADTAKGPKDKGGRLLEAGAIVVMTAKKQKDQYHGFKAKILRVNTQHVVLSILEGPRKGDKRKHTFATVDVVEEAPKKANIPPTAAAPAAETAAPPAAAPAAEAESEDEEQPQPDNQCMAMFGDLDLYT